MRRDALIVLAVVAALLAWLALQTREERAPGQTLSSGQLLGDAPGSFRRVTGPEPLHFPDDHAAHPGFRSEWWYFTGNLETAEGRHFGFQYTLFRFELGEAPPSESAWASEAVWMAHLAVSDIAAERFYQSERFSRGALGLAGASQARWWLRDWEVTREGERFRIDADAADFGLELDLEQTRPIVLQGERGYSQKGPEPGNASRYYSITRLAATGRLRIGDRHHAVDGLAWLDREWGSSQLGENVAGWDWFALQLDDGRDLMVYRLRETGGGATPFSAGKIVRPDGSSRTLESEDFTTEPERYWQDAFGVRWPVEWRVRVPSENLDLRVESRFDAQRWTGSVSYWEGAVGVRDADSGESLGRGYLELSGYAD
jgi:predicted secreted hydrolase